MSGFSGVHRCVNDTYASCSERQESSVNLRLPVSIMDIQIRPSDTNCGKKNVPDKSAAVWRRRVVGFARHQFQWSCKVALTINSTICSKSSGKVKNLMFSAGFAEMFVSISKCSRLFLSPDMRASAGIVLVQSSDNLSQTSTQMSLHPQRALILWILTFRRGENPQTNKHTQRRLFQVTLQCSRWRGQYF